MATEEPVVVVEPVPEPAASEKEEPKVEAEKKTKESKPKKASKPRSPASHPTYEEMIKDAIVSLKERTGSSQYAIAKFIEEKHKQQLPSNFKKLLLQNLKKNVASGKLVKVKGSFKLPSKTTKPSSSVTTASQANKKPAASKPKTKPSASKSKAKTVVKPKAASKPKTAAVKTKTTVAKPKPAAAKSKVAAKPKAGVKAKPKDKSAKVARTSTRTSPGKKVPKKVVAAKKAPVKSVKPKIVKSPAKKVS
ncbi:histone H1, partial [Trifolium pratense]